MPDSLREIWGKMDAIVAEPYGLDSSTREAELRVARDLERRILPILSRLLNNYHKVNYSERYWQIVLGHWLRRFIELMINRVKTFQQCISSHSITGTSFLIPQKKYLATEDTVGIVYASRETHWDNLLIHRIVKLLDLNTFPVEVISQAYCQSIDQKRGLHAPINFLGMARRIVIWLLSFFSRNHDAFIINSYLPKIFELKLQILLGQFPIFWKSRQCVVTKEPDLFLRERLTREFLGEFAPADKLQEILGALLFEVFPVSLLEEYSDLDKTADQQCWPKIPKLIFTSNNFDSDELFKLWAAKRVDRGSTYIIGQHGNNYGTHRYMYPSIEEITADKFLTWGWVDGLRQHTPMFNFKAINKKSCNYDKLGALLLIETSPSYRIATWDSFFDFGDYLEQQKEFIGGLSVGPRSELILRLHAGHADHQWNQIARLHDFDPALNIESGKLPIEKLISNSRLVVHSYDSTGILESLSLNIPTIAFWKNEFDHLREGAMPYYQLLVDVGIVHLSAESASRMVNEVWGDIDDWWFDENVQRARKDFCNRYALKLDSALADLKKILNSQ